MAQFGNYERDVNKRLLKRKAMKSGSQNHGLAYKKARNGVNYTDRCAKS